MSVRDGHDSTVASLRNVLIAVDLMIRYSEDAWHGLRIIGHIIELEKIGWVTQVGIRKNDQPNLNLLTLSSPLVPFGTVA